SVAHAVSESSLGMREAEVVAPGPRLSSGSQISSGLSGTWKPLVRSQLKYCTFSGSQDPTGYQPRIRVPRVRKRGSRGEVTRGSGVVVVYPTSAGSYPLLRISSARFVWRVSRGTEFCTTR